MITNNDISTAITTGRTSFTTAFSEYYVDRKKGKVCNPLLINMGVLIAYTYAITGFVVNLQIDFCFTVYEVEKLIDALNDTSEIVINGCL
jgi:hypothetical protein